MNREAEQIAAELLVGDDGWYGNLEYSLANVIKHAEQMLEGRDAKLRSRQAIAAIIVAWQLANPGKEAYVNE